ncbi:MAG: hypothetical protein WCK47_11085 [bacterium]
MQCPYCQTENRDDRAACYACEKDLSMMRLAVNKAKHHYNLALEHAERGRVNEGIEELHNALDLDRKFINAHVVLGTLYAKRNEFDKARESWNAALALMPELAKARSYLDRLQTVQSSLPLVRRLRGALVVMIAFVVMLAGGLGYYVYSGYGRSSIRLAHKAFESGRYNTALVLLNRVKLQTRPDSLAHATALALQSAIMADMNQRLKTIQDLKRHDEFEAALTAIADLESHEPDNSTSASLAMIRDDINHYYQQKIEQMYDQYLKGAVVYSDLNTRVQEFLRLYPNLPEKDALASYMERAREVEVERRLDSIRNEFLEKHDANDVVSRLQNLSAEYPGAEALKNGRRQLVDEILSWMMLEQFQALMDSGDYAGARSMLKHIAELASEFKDVVDISGPLDLAMRVLTDTEKTGHLKQAEKLIADGEFEDAEDVIFNLMADTELTTGERELVNSLMSEIDQRILVAGLKRLKEREQRYLALRITDTEASQTLSFYRTISEEQLVKMEAPDRMILLSAATAAAIKADDRALAGKLFARIEQEKPPKAKLDALRKILKRKS